MVKKAKNIWLYMSLKNATCIASSVFLLVVLLGCVQAPITRPETDIDPIKKIAVLPFENFTADRYAGEKMRRIVITELLSEGVEVIEPGEVTRLLKEMELRSLSSLGVPEIQELGKTLGVEAVMAGSVEAFGISQGISVSYPEVTINLMLLDASSGTILWSVRSTSGGANFWTRHFGAEGMSLSETARKVVKKAFNTLF